MKKLTTLSVFLIAAGLQAAAQNGPLPASWQLEDCIDYAVEHNRNVRIAQRNQHNSRLSTVEAYTAFLPHVSAGVGAQFSFGRTIESETNAYTTVSNFNNSYSLNASLPLFNSGALIQNVRIARIQEMMGLKSLEQTRDNIALETLKAYMDVLYYRELHAYHQGKLEESRRQLHRLRKLHELGRRSQADLTLVEAQCAADEHALLQGRSQVESALLALRNRMSLPADTRLDAQWLTPPPVGVAESNGLENGFLEADRLFQQAEAWMPATANARHTVQANRYSLRQSIGNLFPTLSLSGGLSSGYFKTLEKGEFDSFHKQFRDKLGYYVGVNMSIPIFGRLNRVYGIKRQRNRLRNAIDDYELQRDELQRSIRQAVMDRELSLIHI